MTSPPTSLLDDPSAFQAEATKHSRPLRSALIQLDSLREILSDTGWHCAERVLAPYITRGGWVDSRFSDLAVREITRRYGRYHLTVDGSNLRRRWHPPTKPFEEVQ